MKIKVKQFGTNSGKLIDYDNIKESDVCLHDIAHHLSKIQRYNGALPLQVSYTVAEHSLNLCNWVQKQVNADALSMGDKSKKGFGQKMVQWALLHDAAEAYTGDLFPALKSKKYKNIELTFEKIIYKKYIDKNLTFFDEVTKIISNFDKRIVMNEIETMFSQNYHLYTKVNNRDPLVQCKIKHSLDVYEVLGKFVAKSHQIGIINT